MKKRECELNETIGKLLNTINALRALRIENVNETLDMEGRKNQLEIANDKLYKEICKLNSLVDKLKLQAKK